MLGGRLAAKHFICAFGINNEITILDYNATCDCGGDRPCLRRGCSLDIDACRISGDGASASDVFN